jgi:flagellar biogenesis protein FliO
MNRKLFSLSLMTLASFSAFAGVKVTSLDLKTIGTQGQVNISLAGRSSELPDLRVYGKTIEITLSDSESFNAISKSIHGAQLSANVLKGKAVVKAVLPYDVSPEGVDIGWKNSNIEVRFPRGKVARTETDRPLAPAKPEVPQKTENKVLSKVENAVVKEKLNEDYLNNLMNEETTKTARRESDAQPPKIEEKKDEVKVQQSAISKPVVEDTSPKKDNFSFAAYAAKFTIFLAMVLGLFYGVVQLLKKGLFNRGKLGFLNNSQLIQVLSTTYVAPKRSLMVVKAHNQIFLVANSESGLQFLSEMTDTTGLIKEGEKHVTGTNFDMNLGAAAEMTTEPVFKLKENINESSPVPPEKGIAGLSAKDIVKFSDELKKKAKKLKPIEFN